MAREEVVFTNFASGEYGLLSPFGVGFRLFRQHMLYVGYWTGTNVVRTIDGGLCPRWEPKAVACTGAPAAPQVVHAGLGYGTASSRQAWVIHRNVAGSKFAVWQVDADNGGAWAHIGDLSLWSSAGEIYDSVSVGTKSYLCAGINKVHTIDHYNGTVAVIAGSNLGGRCITVYGDRLMVGGPPTNPNRIYFSAAADFNTWPAAGFFDVGNTDLPIVALYPLGNSLVIVKSPTPILDGVTTGQGTEWWLMTGVPGFNNVLRRVSLEPTPSYPWNAALLANRTVAFARQSMFEPASFNGSVVGEARYLNEATAGPLPVVRRLKEPGDTLICDGTVALLNREGAWSRHTGLDAYGAVPYVHAPPSVPYPAPVVSDPSTGLAYLVKADMSQVSAWQPGNQRPAFVTDTQAAVPDPAACGFSLPEWWTRSSTDVSVDTVVVDFRKYNTADSNHPNTFTVRAVPLRMYAPPGDGTGASGADGTVPQAFTYSEAASAGSASGTRARLVARFDAQPGGGFRIDVSNMRGVVIDKIVPVCDTSSPRGVR